jgi:hypothetical protein
MKKEFTTYDISQLWTKSHLVTLMLNNSKNY